MKHILIIISLAMCLTAGAQELSGTVVGENYASKEKSALAGAIVRQDGTSRGSVTMEDGAFFFEVDATKPLVIIASYVGFHTDTILIEKEKLPLKGYEIVLKEEVMEEVDVRARKMGTVTSRSATLSSQTITADELCKAACCNLGESFETNASVDVNYADAATGAKTIQMLGLQGRYVQMMTENVPSFRGIATPFGLSYVPGPWMNGISLSKGVGTVVNGYEAVTGQIDIAFKRPNGNTERAAANAFVSSSGRLEVNGNVNLLTDKPLQTTIMVSAAKDVHDMDENDDHFRDEPRTQQFMLFNRWFHHDKFYTFDLAMKTLNEKRFGGDIDFDDETQPTDGTYGVFINTDRFEAWMKNGFVFNDEFNMGFPMGYSYHHQSSFFGDRSYVGTQHSWNINSIVNKMWGDRHTIHAGISTQGDIYDETVDYGEGEKELYREDISYGAYFQYTFKYEDILSVIAGIRADRHNHYGEFVTPRLHVRYQPVEHTIIRLAAGKGYRGASIFAENNYLLTSKRKWTVEDYYGFEKAWNYGINVTQYIHIGGNELQLNAEYYRTDFEEQMVTDMDVSARDMVAKFSDGESYANNFQIEGKMSPLRGLDITAAWRYSDSHLELNGMLQRRPLVSKYKGLVAVSYQTPLKTWQFDMNVQFCGGGRLPSTADNPEQYRRGNTFSSYQMYNGQITKWFRHWSIYGGVENIGNFMQENPIVAAEDPSSDYFDSSMIWGPLMSRKFYLGLRWNIDRE